MTERHIVGDGLWITGSSTGCVQLHVTDGVVHRQNFAGGLMQRWRCSAGWSVPSGIRHG